MSGLVMLDDDSFDRFQVESHQLTLVDFSASWCGPCQAMTPRLEMLAGQLQSQVRFAKVDVDQAPGTAKCFQIRSVPTLVLMRKGEMVSQQIGLRSSADIASWIKDALEPPHQPLGG